MSESEYSDTMERNIYRPAIKIREGNRMITYKKIEHKEIERFWDFLTVLDSETDYMMYEPGERKKRTSLSELTADIENNVIYGEDYLQIALCHHKIIGYLRAERGKFNRVHHTAYITTGILSGYRGNGIGTVLFENLEKWAKENHICRLELSVECQNKAAEHLYEKSGFVIEGTRKNAMYVDGKYRDEYYMAKILQGRAE